MRTGKQAGTIERIDVSERVLLVAGWLAADDGGVTVSNEPLWWPPSKVASRRLDIALRGTRTEDRAAHGWRDAVAHLP